MINPIFKESTTHFSSPGSHLLAIVIESTLEGKESTTITIQDDQDYDYIHSEYSEALDEKTISERVEMAFKQASKINKPASKYGEEVPTIKL